MYKLTVKFHWVDNTLERIRPRYSLKKKIYRYRGELVEDIENKEDKQCKIVALFENKDDAVLVFNMIKKWNSVKEAEVREL